MEHGFGLREGLVFLAATVIAVPLFKRLGLGAILGYLVAGLIIGPNVLGLVGNVESVVHVAEFGVVLLLFVLGLELQPSRLWQLRADVFGVGSAQVALTTIVFMLGGKLLGLGWLEAFVAGFGLSLSSTAFAVQLLSEKKELTTDFGRSSFGVLLFQDLAAIPMLAVLPALTTGSESDSSGWILLAKAAAILVGLVVAGRFVLRPIFRIVAQTHIQETFTATALLVVLGIALLVSSVGLSMALGSFLAGVLLAESEYRHELEADIEPFKGLLLGLFFIAVGMSLNLSLLLSKPWAVLGLVAAILVVKAAVLLGLGLVRLRRVEGAASMALVLAEGGEFAFVLFGVAGTLRLMSAEVGDLLVVAVTLTMVLTPFLFSAYGRWVRPALKTKTLREFDVKAEEDAPVIIAGFGRVGQVVGRMLRAKRIPFTALDVNPEHIEFIKKFGNKVFFGDASRLDLLRAARADKARVFVVAIDDVQASVRTVEAVQQHFPHLKIFARARNRQHAYALKNLGVKNIMRETFLSSMELAGDVLVELGMPHSERASTLQRFLEHDEHLLEQTYRYSKDEKKLQELAQAARKELEEIFNQDQRAVGGK